METILGPELIVVKYIINKLYIHNHIHIVIVVLQILFIDSLICYT